MFRSMTRNDSCQPWTQDNKKRNSGNMALLLVRVEELAVFQIIKVFFPACQICLSHIVRHKVCLIKQYHCLIPIFPSLPAISSQLLSIPQRTNDFSDIYCFHVFMFFGRAVQSDDFYCSDCFCLSTARQWPCVMSNMPLSKAMSEP